MPIKNGYKSNTTFTSHVGTYHHNRVHICLRNAPSMFQHALDIILSGVLCNTCLILVYEVIIFPKNNSPHGEHIDEAVTHLHQDLVNLKLSNGRFAWKENWIFWPYTHPWLLSYCLQERWWKQDRCFPDRQDACEATFGSMHCGQNFHQRFL